MISRTFEIPAYCLKNHPRDDIFASKNNGEWEKVSTAEYLEKSRLIALGLLSLGLKKNDKIATICSNNRHEWNFIDMGSSMAGLIHVPVYPTLSKDEFKFIFNQAKIKYIFISDEKIFRIIAPILKESPSVASVFSILGPVKGTSSWKKILDLGLKNESNFKDKLALIQQNIRAEDPVTLIYSSGTTGAPKGVLLSHNNLCSSILATSKLHSLKYGEKYLSFLPLSHIYERITNYQFQYSGLRIYYAENFLKIQENIIETRPNAITAVPRILEKLQNQFILHGEELNGWKKKLFQYSIDLTKHYPDDHKKTLVFRIKNHITDLFVFKKFRKQMGDNIKFIGCGGAKLNPRVERFLWTAGLPVFQGYGLTETSPLISLNTIPIHNSRIGSIGPIIPGVKVKIAKDGEILCKGPNVMLGYYHDEESTRNVISAKGWFHTGDKGYLSADGFLYITGRKKEIFKTSYGKYVAPQHIESRFRESLLIIHIMVVGEGRQFTGALILPNFELLYKWIKSIYKTREFNKEELINLPQIQNLLKIEINQINKSLSNFEQIKNHYLICDDWSVSTGEFSHNLKLKRSFIQKKYSHQINHIFKEKGN